MSYPAIRFSSYLFEKPDGFANTGDSRIVENEIPRRNGSVIVSPKVLKSRTISIKETLVADTPTALQTKFDNMRAILISGTQPLYLFNNRYINAVETSFSTDYVRGTNVRVANCAVHFLAVDPFVYSDTPTTDTKTVTATGQSKALTKLGNAPIRPVITISSIVTATITTLQISNGGNSFTLANLSAGQTWIVDLANYTCTKNAISDLTDFSGTFFQITPSDKDLVFTVNPSPCNFLCTIAFRDTYYDF